MTVLRSVVLTCATPMSRLACRYPVVVSMLLWAGLGLSAQVTDRVRPGQWAGTTVVGGKTYPTSSCLSPTDATALNGDAKAVRGYLEQIIPSEICTITDV